MALLGGFRAAKPQQEGRQATETQVANLVTEAYLNRTKYGEFNTVEEIDGAIAELAKLPQSVVVMEKIAELQNKKLQIGAKLNDLLNDKNLFDTDLQEQLTFAARNNFDAPLGLVGAYAAIYGDAAQRFEDDIATTISERYGTADKIPQEVLDYRKELEEKANTYGSLFNSYQFQDPDTGELGIHNGDAFAFKIDTNPATGNITRVEIVPAGNSTALEGYMRTDTPLNLVDGAPSKKVPVYLKTFDAGTSETGVQLRGARLGAFTYMGSATKPSKADQESLDGIGFQSLKVQNTDKQGLFERVGRAVVPKWFGWEDSLFGPEQQDVIDVVRQDGINFKNFQFDSNDIPDGVVLRMGNRLFYSTDADNELLEVKGANENERRANLQKYLQGNGKDTRMMDVPYFITRQSLQSPDGSSRIKGSIDANTFQPQLPTSPQASALGPRPAASTTAPSSVLQPNGFFANQLATGNQTTTPATLPNRTNRPNIPEQSVESREGVGNFFSDVIEKGKSFFRKINPFD